jgi:hypothetical protein
MVHRYVIYLLTFALIRKYLSLDNEKMCITFIFL